jgi:ABC-2 type transport system permease protein
MNILKRELKAGLKPFIFWTIGLFVLVFIGLTKSTGLSSGGEGMMDLINAFPKVVLAIMGMAGVQLDTFGGFYSVLALFALVLTAVYAVWLGNSAVGKESVDKTFEFIFTKPRSRSYILERKLLAGLILLTLYSVLYYLFSIAAVAVLKLEDIDISFVPFAIGIWVVGLTFYCLSAFLTASSSAPERGAKIAYFIVLLTYIIGVIYDTLENGGIIRFLSPFKYFLSKSIMEGRFDTLYLVPCIIIIVLSLVFAFRSFEKRDLNAA